MIRRLPPTRDEAADAGFLLVLATLALLGFVPTYGGWRPVLAGVAGTVLGIAVTHVSARSRGSLPTTLLAGLVVFFAFGGVLVLQSTTLLGIPTLATLSGLIDGAVHGWARLLTTVPPAGSSGTLAVIPYLLGLACGLTGLLLARRPRPVWLPLLPPGGLLAATILLGTDQPVSVLLQGGAFAAVAMLWVSRRQARGRNTVHGVSPWSWIAGGAVLLTVAAVAGLLLAPHLPLAQANERLVLRDHTEPPFDPRDYSSPLARMRKYVTEEKDATVFTVTGMPEGGRLRLATMDLYDGTVWNVAGGVGKAVGSSGYFERVGEQIPVDANGARAAVTVDVGRYDGVWVPGLGQATEIRFEGPRAGTLAESFRYNRATGQGVTTARLTSGDRIVMDVVVPPARTEKELAGLAALSATQPEPREVPPAVKDKAVDLVGEARSAGDRAVALGSTLQNTGFFSQGQPGQAASRPGHGARRVADFLAATALIGDAEQYAATAGLMARTLGLPTRVVMGWVPKAPGQFRATGNDVTAWLEVGLDGAGWVPVDVTPSRDRVFDKKVQQPQPQPQPEVQLPPPPLDLAEPVPAPVDLSSSEDDGDDAEEAGSGLWLTVLRLAGIVVGIPLLIVATPVLLLLAVKARRRRRRRSAMLPASRIAGGWDEVLDRSRDFGDPVPVLATRSESAVAVAVPAADGLASRADRAVFGPTPPTDSEAEEYWRIVDDQVRARWHSLSPWARFKAAASVKSLRRR